MNLEKNNHLKEVSYNMQTKKHKNDGRKEEKFGQNLTFGRRCQPHLAERGHKNYKRKVEKFGQILTSGRRCQPHLAGRGD